MSKHALSVATPVPAGSARAALPLDAHAYRRYGKVVLFFSGGLDTSFLLHYLTSQARVEVVAVAFDVGGDETEVASLRARAKALGALKFIQVDARERLIREFAWKAVKANALFQGAHPLSSSLSRPLMAALGVEIARQEGCKAIVHGANGWQNNSSRFDTSIRVLAPDLDVLEPIMESGVTREQEHTYLAQRGFAVGNPEQGLVSTDNNLWGREFEDGIVEDNTREPPETLYRLTRAPETAPDVPEFVEVGFERGVPVSLDGAFLQPVALVERLNQIGGAHGVGRHDALEDKTVGIKYREIHESPAATMLIHAHRDLESAVLPRQSLAFKSFADTQWTHAVCHGLWFHPLREQLDALIDKCNERVTGTVRLKLFKGSARIVGRSTPFGLFHQSLEGKFTPYPREPHPGRNYYDYYAFEARLWAQAGLTRV